MIVPHVSSNALRGKARLVPARGLKRIDFARSSARSSAVSEPLPESWTGENTKPSRSTQTCTTVLVRMFVCGIDKTFSGVSNSRLARSPSIRNVDVAGMGTGENPTSLSRGAGLSASNPGPTTLVRTNCAKVAPSSATGRASERVGSVQSRDWCCSGGAVIQAGPEKPRGSGNATSVGSSMFSNSAMALPGGASATS